ncbi:MAG: transporter substrate-binding domain-containing protein [Lachnospiraceae bacterium]|nr:transporter substrate-binding domain-containing protein [Lachnospiraceae bacterium]
MKKLISLTLILALTLTLFAACGKDSSSSSSSSASESSSSSSDSDFDYVKKNGKMIVGITEYKPMNYEENGELVGFDTEFTKKVCEKLGVEPVFQEIDWETKESLIKAKNIDCIWNGFTVTEERKANVDFSKVYLLNKQVLVIDSRNKDKYTDTASLASAMISAEVESAGEAAIKADENLSKASYAASDKQMSALTQLVAGNYDAVVLDYTLAKANVGKGDFENLMIVEGINLTNEEYAIGFRKGSDLVPEINKAIDELIADGTLKAIAEKYELVELYEDAVK